MVRRAARLARSLGSHRAYEAATWWDHSFYTESVSDRQTIGPRKNPITAAYHYASVELLIAEQFARSEWSPRRVCDLGSGAGHWLDWYAELGAEVVGIEVSEKAIAHLAGRHEVHHGRAADVLPRLGRFDAVNAIGVMFHIVDDAEWEATIGAAADALSGGGLFIVGGEFGRFTYDAGVSEGQVYKRLRSERRWREALQAAGFSTVTIRRNRRDLPDTLPENNVLTASIPTHA